MLRKLGNSSSLGQFLGTSFGGLTMADVTFAWNDGTDCDLVFGLAQNNTVREIVFFDNLSSMTGAVRLDRDKRNGLGLSKFDETGHVNLSALPAQYTEVAVGVLTQSGVLGSVNDAKVIITDTATGRQLVGVDVDATFSSFPGGKIGEFRRNQASQWDFYTEFRGFADLDNMAFDLAR